MPLKRFFPPVQQLQSTSHVQSQSSRNPTASSSVSLGFIFFVAKKFFVMIPAESFVRFGQPENHQRVPRCWSLAVVRGFTPVPWRSVFKESRFLESTVRKS